MTIAILIFLAWVALAYVVCTDEVKHQRRREREALERELDEIERRVRENERRRNR